MNPKLSICLPNFNSASFLHEAIESALKQSYTNFEFIIIDNCSTDKSCDIIQKYAKKDPRIRFSVNDHNVGMVNNLNLCLQYAKGEYVKYLLSDDLFSSSKILERMVSILDANKSVSLVATARNVIDDHSVIREVLSEYKAGTGYVGTDIIQDCLIEQRNRVGEPSVVMFRKKHAGRGFDLRYQQIVDLEMWFRILEQGNFAYIDEPLCAFRKHLNQQTQIISSQRVLSNEAFQLLEDYSGKQYLILSMFTRAYMLYVPIYAVWKLYKKRKISRETALTKIRSHISISKFFALYPFFKLYRFFKSTARQCKHRTTKTVIIDNFNDSLE